MVVVGGGIISLVGDLFVFDTYKILKVTGRVSLSLAPGQLI